MAHFHKQVAGIILAGGKGERLGGYKQFFKVAGEPLLFYSIRAYLQARLMDIIVVVVPREKLRYATGLVLSRFPKKRIYCIAGGATRNESTYRALRYLSKLPVFLPQYVILHDAVRPCITAKMVRAVYATARRFGNAVTAFPVLDFTAICGNRYISRTLRKNETFSITTPQCFSFFPLLQAHEENLGQPNKFVDNVEILKNFFPQGKIKIVGKFYPNIKITYASDILMAEALLK